MPSMRPWVSLLIAMAIVVAVDGCGGSSAPAPATPPAATAAGRLTPAGAPGSVSASAGGAVQLGITPAQLEAKLGGAATPLRPFKDGTDCVLYRIAEEPPFVKLRYCFQGGRLEFFSTYAVEGSP
jgi:hypothetical protein